MNYLISKFNASLNGKFDINKGVLYELGEDEKFCVYAENQVPYIFDLEKLDAHILKITVERDVCYVLYPYLCFNGKTLKVKCGTKDVFISISDQIIVSCNDHIYTDEIQTEITYSHYENFNGVDVLFFEGKRKFVVFISENEISGTFYDEYNNSEEEQFFVCYMFDCLNHGKVFHIKSGKLETYLVYLDNEEMLLKEQFVPCVCLDCVKCGNLKYANELFVDNCKQEDEKILKTFFEEFDDYFVFKDYYILTKKNTLAGIYKFEIKDCKIENIINLLW